MEQIPTVNQVPVTAVYLVWGFLAVIFLMTTILSIIAEIEKYNKRKKELALRKKEQEKELKRKEQEEIYKEALRKVEEFQNDVKEIAAIKEYILEEIHNLKKMADREKRKHCFKDLKEIAEFADDWFLGKHTDMKEVFSPTLKEIVGIAEPYFLSEKK
jgi:pyruvate-formate lyase